MPQERLTAGALQRRFAAPPVWHTEARQEHWPASQPLRKAAVLIGLQTSPQAVPHPDAAPHLQVIFTQRQPYLDVHPGQIAFPGGKIDPTDTSAAAAALREAHEEVGLPPAQATVLGTLPVYKTGTGFCVTPVVALLAGNAALAANPQEVSEIFHVPLPFLMNPANHRKHLWQPRGHATQQHECFSMPYTPAGSHKNYFIWGITAGILRDFYQFLLA